ncbi:DUF7927 domain-containing protein [Chitinophaga silvatica]|nr:gliding motility-associated C-terminal domain-containing protein [Chitinophaga silvatica]
MQLLFNSKKKSVNPKRRKPGKGLLRTVFGISLLMTVLLVRQIAVGGLLPEIKKVWSKIKEEPIVENNKSKMFAVPGTSPGGVTGSVLWLRADDASSNNASWKDFTGNGLEATQTVAANKPTLVDDGINFNYAYTFSDKSLMTIPNSTIAGKFPFANKPRTLIAVGTSNSQTLSGGHGMMFSYGSTVSNGLGTFIGQIVGNGVAGFGAYNGGTFNAISPAGKIIQGVPRILGGRYTTGLDVILDLDGTQTAISTGSTWNTDGTQDAFVGRGSIGGSAAYWNGKTGEIILYDRALNATELQKVYSYLGIKYGITVYQGTQNYLASNGSVCWPADATYKNRITGIGRDDLQALSTKQSLNADAGEITLSLGNVIAASNAQNTGNFPNDASFFVIADNGLESTYSASVTSTKATYRTKRVWKVNKTNWVDQPITLKADLPGNNVYLLISTNPTFATINQEILLNPDKTVTLNSSLIPNGAYFAFATFAKYPGGIPGALLWLRPDIGTSSTVNNSPVSSWLDYAYNQNNATQATASLQPLYVDNPTDNVNYNPLVKFDGVDDYLNLNINRLPLGVTPKTFIGTGYVNTGGNTNKYILAYGGSTTNTGMGLGCVSTSNIGAFVGYNDYLGTTTNPFWQNGKFNDLTAVWAGNSASIFSKSLLLNNGTKTYNTATGGAMIGNAPWGANQAWNGPIGDVMVYGTNLTPADQARINTYLAIKYGYTIDQSTGRDYIATDGTTKVWTATVNTVYNKNITGIGRDDLEDLMQKQSRSINPGLHPIVGLGNIAASNKANSNSFTSDMSYLVWGDNGAANTFSMAVTGRPDVSHRMARLWKVQNTGNVGTVQIAIPKDSLPNVFTKVFLAKSSSAIIDGSSEFIPLTEANINGVDCYVTTTTLTDGQFFTYAAMASLPGGVAGNALWVRGDIGLQVNGSNQVQQWFDQSGSGNTATELRASITNSNNPIAPSADIIQTQNGINFNPVAQFSGATNKSLKGNAAVTWSNSEPLAMFFVAFPKGVPQTGMGLAGVFTTSNLSGAPAGAGRGVVVNGTAKAFSLDGNGCTPASTTSPIDVVPTVGRGVYVSSTTGLGGSTWLNGKLEATGTGCATGSDGSFFEVAGRTVDTYKGRIFNGLIAEVIVYKSALTPVQAQQIESYLAIKYGVTLNQATAQDYLAADGTTKVWDATTNSTYKNNIFGIGRDDIEKLNQKQSRSVNDAAILTVGLGTLATTNATNTNNFSSDKSYLMMGANSTAKTVQGTNIPANSCITERLTQQWKAQLTNFNAATQPLRLQFDLTGISASGTSLSDFILLIDQDGDGNFGTGTITQIPATDFANGVVGFDNVDALANGVVFTLATRYPSRTASLVPAGQVKTAANICIDGDWVYFRHPDDITKYIAAIKLNGNTIDLSKLSAVIDANQTPANIGKNVGTDYGTQLVNRFVQITYTGAALTTNGGVTVRIFQNPAEKTAAENYLSGTRAVTRPQTYNWFQYNGAINSIISTDLDATGLKNKTILTPAASGQIDGVEYVDFSGIQQLGILGGEVTSDVIYTDLAITKTDGQTTYAPGADVVYTVTVNNLSANAVTGATILDQLPVGISAANMSWSVTAVTGGAIVPANSGTGALSQQADIPGGASITYEVTIKVPSSYTGNLVNTATVTAPAATYADTNPANNSATDTDTWAPQVNLHITKSATPDPALAGREVQYTITVTNAGKSDVTGATITDNLPAGLSTTSWTATATGTNASVTPVSGTGNVSATANIPGGNSGTITIVVKGLLSPDYTGATLDNTANVASPVGITDTDPTDNVSSISTTVQKKTDLIITKINATNATIAGSPITYRITVGNNGPATATGVRIQDVVPAEVIVSSVVPAAAGTATLGTDNTSGSNIDVTATIPPGPLNYVTIEVNGTIDPAFAGTLTNTATATAAGGDPVSATRNTVISRKPALTIVKNAPASIVSGAEITYVITVENNGLSDALNANVFDQVPANISNVSWTTAVTGNAKVNGSTSGTGNAVDVHADIPAGTGNRLTITIKGTVSPAATGTIDNIASLTPSEANIALLNVIASTTVNKIPQLSINKSGPTSIAAGENILYTIHVANQGTANADNISITDNLPVGISNSSWTATANGNASVTAGSGGTGAAISVNGNIPAGSNNYITITVTGKVNPAFVGSSINNSATVNSTEAGKSWSSDVTTMINKVAAVSIIKSGPADKNAGQEIEYKLQVTNAGPSTSIGTTITDIVPASIENVTWTTSASGGASVTANGTGSGNSLNITADIPVAGVVNVLIKGNVKGDAVNVGSYLTVNNTASVAVAPGITDPDLSDNFSTRTTLISNVAELIVSKSGPERVNIGDPITYVIEVTNTGTGAVSNAQINDVIPSEVNVTNWAASPANGAIMTGAISGTTSPVNLFASFPGNQNSKVTIIVNGTVNNTANTSFTNKVVVDAGGNNKFSEVTTTVNKSTDLKIQKIGPSSIAAGEDITYTLTVTNAGPLDAPDCSISDILPADLQNVTWTAIANGTSTISSTSGSGSLNLTGDIMVGDANTITITVKGKVKANTTNSSMVNLSSVLTPGYINDYNPNNNTSNVITSIIQKPGVRIVKSGSATAIAGTGISYVLDVYNDGPSDVSNLNITDVLPADIINPKWTATTVGTATINSGSSGTTGSVLVTGSIAAGSGNKIIIMVTGTVNPAFEGTLNNVATALALPVIATPVSSNAISTIVSRITDIAVAKSANKTVVNAGEALGYTVTVTNIGPATLKSGEELSLIETLPVGLNSVIFTATGGTYDRTANTFKLTSDMAAGATVQLKIDGTVVANYNGTSITNHVEVGAPTGVTDSDPTNNTADAVASTRLEADLEVIKVADKTTVTAGDPITYTITVINNGPGAFNSGDIIKITEILPAALENVTYNPTGGTYDKTNNSFTLTGNFISGNTIQLEVSGTVAADFTGTNISNSVTVASQGVVTDPVPENNTSTASVTVVRKADLAVAKTVDKTAAKAGEAINYTVTITNKGVSTIKSGEVIKITETLPAEMLVSSYDPTGGSYDANSGAFTLTSDLPANGVVKLLIKGNVDPATLSTTMANTVVVAVPSGITDTDLSNNTATSSTTTISRVSDLAVTKTVDKTTAVAGDQITYTVTVQNKGISTLKSGEIIGLTETLPAALIVGSYTPTGGTYDATANTFTLAADLATNGVVTLVIKGNIDPATTSSSMTNTVSVTTPSGVTDSDVSNNTATSQATTISRESDLAVSKTVNKTSVVAGEAISYTVTIQNKGTSTLKSGEVIGITETLPAELVVGSYTETGGTYDATAKTFTLNSNLAKNGTVSLVINGIVNAATTSTSMINNVAVTTPAGVTDTDLSNNTATSPTTTIRRESDLEVIKAVDKTTAVAGEAITYTITITNNGTSTLRSGEVIGITETLPAELVVGSYIPTGGTYDASAKTFTLTSDLAKTGTVTLVITGKVDPATTSTSMINNVVVTAPTGVTDIDLTNNTASSDATTISRASDLAVTKTVDKTSAIAGEALTYTVTITNKGLTTLKTGEVIGVTETLPSQLVVSSYTATGGDYDATAGTFTLTGDFEKDATVTLVINGTVNATTTSTSMQNTVSVAMPAGITETDATNNTATSAATTISRSADLEVTKTVDKTSAAAGDAINYTITITNKGISSLRNGEVIGITETLPAQLIVGSYAATGGTYDATAGTFTLTSDLAKDAAVTLEIKGTIDPATTSTSMVNSVAVTAPTGVTDANSANNSATSPTTTISRKIDLSVSKTVSKASAVAGEAISYTVTIENKGISTLKSGEVIGITETLPAELVVSSYTATGGTYDATAGTFTLTSNLAKNGTVSLVINGTVNAATTSTSMVNNVAVATPAGITDTDPSNNTATSPTTTIRRESDLEVTKAVNKTTAVAGEAISYTITITNNGATTLRSGEVIGITETLPAELIVSGYTATGGTYDASAKTFTLNSNLAQTGTVTLVITGTVDPATTSTSMINKVEATVPTGVTDNDLTNNTASSAATTISRASDLAVTKTVDKTSVIAGEVLTYTVTITNNGLTTLKSGEVIGITETLPSELVVSGYTATGGVYDATAGTFTLSSNLVKDAAVTLVINGTVSATTTSTSMQNTVAVTLPTGITETDATNNTATSAATTISRSADLEVTKTVDKTTAVAGDAINYTITITNKGLSSLRNGEVIGITETLPAQLIVGSYAATGGTYDATAGTFTLTSDLAKDAAVTLEIKGTIDPATTSTSMVNSVAVTAPTGVTDANSANNTATSPTTTINRESDLAVSKTVSKSSVVAGEAISYTVTIENKGSSTLRSGEVIGITETLPAELVVSGYTATGGTYDATAGTFTLSSNLAKNGTVSLVINGTVNAATTSTSMVNNVAVATPAGITDTDLSNNTATSPSTTIRRESDLAVTKAVNKTTAVAGEAISYTITITNNGATTLRSGEVIGITETLPAELIVSGYTATGGTYDASAKTFTLNSNLAQTGTVTLVITGTVDPATTSTSMINKVEATVPTGVTDNDLTNNTASSAATTISRASDLAVTKTVDKTSVIAGEVLTYTVTITNNGLTTLKSGEVIGITETLPSELVVSGYTATGGIYDATAGTFTLSSNLVKDAAVTLVINGTVSATTTSTSMQNTVAVTLPTGITETDATNNTATSAATTISRSADLAVTKTVDKTSAAAGDPINYTITITNKGLSSLRNGEVIGITETLPADLLVGSYVATGGTYDATAGTFTLSSDLAKDAAVTLVIKGTVDPSTVNTNMVNKVVVAMPAGITETDLSNNTASSGITSIRRDIDLSVTKTADKSAVKAGEAVNYTITIQNKGISTLKSGEVLGITETLPAGFIANSYTATGGTYDANAGTFTLSGNLAQNASVTLIVHGIADPATTNTNLVNKVTVAPPVGITDTNPADNTASSAATTISRETDLAVTKTVSKTNAIVGDALNYTITITNNGIGTINSGEVIGITENLPTGFINPAYTATGGTYNAAAGTFTLTSALAAGGMAQVQINGTIAANFTGTSLTNTVSIAPPAGVTDPVTNNNDATAVTTVSRSTDLSVSKTADQPEVTAGKAINYIITVTNHGPAVLNNGETINIAESLPAELTNVTFNAQGGTYNAATGAFQLSAPLPVNGNVQLQVTGIVDANFTGTDITNTVSITSPVNDPDNTNNSASVTTGIVPPPSFETWKTVVTEYGKGQIHAGEKLTYTIFVRNTGKVVIPSVTITDPVPAHTRYVSGGTLSGNNVNFTISNLAAGAVSSVTFVVQADNNLTGISGISNTATVSDGTSTKPTAGCDPAAPGCNTNTPGTNIATGGGDLVVTKEIVTPQSPYRMGQMITYRITAVNNWNQSFNNVVVEDLLPAGLDLPATMTADRGTTQTTATGKGVLWNIGELKAGETLQLILTTRIIDGGEIENLVKITTDEPQNNLTNDTATVTISVNGGDLSFPNVFTPNGDGKNEKFIIGGLEKYPGSSIFIYNRWGSMVYQSKDYRNDWNGSGLNEGTYYYILQVKKQQDTKVYKGWIQILR